MYKILLFHLGRVPPPHILPSLFPFCQLPPHNLLHSCGFAFPRLSLITCPTRKPSTVSLPPRYFSTSAGFASSIWSRWLQSRSCRDLRQTLRFHDSLRRLPDLNISAKTRLPVLRLIVPASTSPINSASGAGVIFTCSIGVSDPFRVAKQSPVSQLHTALDFFRPPA